MQRIKIVWVYSNIPTVVCFVIAVAICFGELLVSCRVFFSGIDPLTLTFFSISIPIPIHISKCYNWQRFIENHRIFSAIQVQWYTFFSLRVLFFFIFTHQYWSFKSADFLSKFVRILTKHIRLSETETEAGSFDSIHIFEIALIHKSMPLWYNPHPISL